MNKLHCEEFQKYKNGLWFTIWFTPEGEIVDALLHVSELGTHIDVTREVKVDRRFCELVNEWLERSREKDPMTLAKEHDEIA